MSADPRSQIPCKFGQSCHGRKNGKCPFKHDIVVNTKPVMSETESDSRSQIPCKFGQSCHGRKNGKCPYKHDIVVDTKPVMSETEPDPRSQILCKFGQSCNGIKNGKCPYKHEDDSTKSCKSSPKFVPGKDFVSQRVMLEFPVDEESYDDEDSIMMVIAFAIIRIFFDSNYIVLSNVEDFCESIIESIEAGHFDSKILDMIDDASRYLTQMYDMNESNEFLEKIISDVLQFIQNKGVIQDSDPESKIFIQRIKNTLISYIQQFILSLIYY